MTNNIHTYEFTWFNVETDEWENCQLYTSYQDELKVIKEFYYQQRDMKLVTRWWWVDYLGEGKDNCGTFYEDGLSLRVF